MSRFGRDLNQIEDGLPCWLIYLVWRVVNRTRQLRLKIPFLLTINSPRETILGFNLTAKRRGELMVNNNGNLRPNYRAIRRARHETGKVSRSRPD